MSMTVTNTIYFKAQNQFKVKCLCNCARKPLQPLDSMLQRVQRKQIAHSTQGSMPLQLNRYQIGHLVLSLMKFGIALKEDATTNRLTHCLGPSSFYKAAFIIELLVLLVPFTLCYVKQWVFIKNQIS